MSKPRNRPQSTIQKFAETQTSLLIHQDLESLRQRSDGSWHPVAENEVSVHVAAELNPYQFDPDIELVTVPQTKPVDPSLGFSWLGTLVAIVLGVVALGSLIVFSIDRVRTVPSDMPTEPTVLTPDIVGAETR